MSIKNYYYLTKPGIIYGNLIAVIAGFFLASKGYFNPLLFLATLLGIGLVIGSGCVFNNYIDREIDEKMDRTKKRALVTKKIPVKNALIFGTILGLLGFDLLYFLANPLTAFIAFVGFFFYVVMYSIWKRKSSFGTIVGSISGAVPPVVGYTAVTNNFDIAAFLLFLILVIWQMPHFYAIAIFRIKDYAEAKIPVLPITKGVKHTKIQMLFYIAALICIAPLLTVFGYTGYLYLVVMLLVTCIWLFKAVKGFKTTDNTLWARNLFKFSLIVLLTFCVVVSFNSFINGI
jgi:protoheme IX farnesyltransferase